MKNKAYIKNLPKPMQTGTLLKLFNLELAVQAGTLFPMVPAMYLHTNSITLAILDTIAYLFLSTFCQAIVFKGINDAPESKQYAHSVLFLIVNAVILLSILSACMATVIKGLI